YRAFESLDIAEMDQVWSHAGHVRCIHPGWGLLVGWDAVRESWDAIFKGSREMRFSIADVRPYGDADLGWVTCTENILSEGRGHVPPRDEHLRAVARRLASRPSSRLPHPRGRGAGERMTTIQTARLTLRPFAAEDTAAHAALYGDPEVTRFLPGGPFAPHEV